MHLSHYLDGDDPIRCCVIGAGGFGRSFVVHARHLTSIDTRIVLDLDPALAASALTDAGIEPGRIRHCRTPAEARRAWDGGDWIVGDRLEAVIELSLDVVIEATGHPEAGARHAALAIEAGHHVALVTKEVDSVVGPGLAAMARKRGCVISPVDGDQPALAIGLISWAETVGLEILAAGKSSEYDFVFDPTAETLTSNGRRIDVPGFGERWDLPAGLDSEGHHQWVADRARIAGALPQHAVPDLCEMAIVANATGLMPDRPALHYPIARLGEIAELFVPTTQGGLLTRTPALEVFHCLRRPDEFSLAGGVFVVVRGHDRASWQMLAEKGHLISRRGDSAMLPLPRHLLGLEAATTLLEMVRRGVPSSVSQPRPHVDLIAMAASDLTEGTTLTAHGHHHSIDRVSSALVPASPLGDDAALPYYLAANRVLIRPVRAGEPIRLRDVAIDESSCLWKLRQRQDALFFAAAMSSTAAPSTAATSFTTDPVENPR
ncbi:flagellar biosynthesis protein FlgA [Salinicola salarius]|uniref:NAD(P)H-dependent oxidoreductase n=1 Tax=Salinicola salarius TaxID=430457 RepID=UPI0023E35834|nr:flagellar biosynthesis protein FlgA [Salinicola salarius]MDF3919303.1 flagellar biosynthesis protein FlgA [Salinicola salarius]